MLIIQEKVDKDYFIDIVLTKAEIEEILEGEMISSEMYVDKKYVSLGIRLPMKGEEDAVKER